MMIWKILALLESRSIADFDATEDFRIEDHGDGQRLVAWDKAKLGPKPTKATLDALATRAAEIQAEAQTDPTAELDAALTVAFDKIAEASTLSGIKAGLADLRAAMLGTSGRKVRTAARPV